MNIFQEAKQILDKDGKVNALGPFGKGKLTGREVSAYFRRNKVSDPEIKKAVEVALDMGGAYDIAGKEIQKFYGRKIRNSKEVKTALKYANEQTWKEGDELEEGQFWGQKKMSKAHTAKLKKDGAVMLQKKEKGGVAQVTFPKGSPKIAQFIKKGYKQIPIESVHEENLDEINMNMPEKVRVQLLTLYNKAMDVPHGSPAFKGIKKQIDKINSKYAVKSEDQSLGKSPTLDEGQSILAKDIQGLRAISDIEIRFSDEKEWKRMAAMVRRELSKPEYKGLPKAYYIDDPLQIGFGHGHKKPLKKVNIKPIVDLVVKNTKDKQTRLKSLDEEKYPQSLLLKNKGEFDPRKMSSMQKKKFDALYKKMDGGKEHMAIKKKIKNQVRADDAFQYMIMKKVMGEEVAEAFSKTPKSGAEVAKMMMKSKTLKGFANKVKKMKTVTAVQLDKMLPDYVSGGDIGAMFEEVTEAKNMQGRFDGKYSTGSKTKAALVYSVPYNRLHGEVDISAAEALAKKFKLKYKGANYKMMAEMTIEVEGSPENLKKFHSALTKPKVIKSVDGKRYLKVKLQKIYDYNITESVDITEGKLGDSIIRKDFPNVWAASAKDRSILKKFHAKVDTKNYKAQKQLYNKNKKAFMSGLGKEKLSSIMKKMTVKKGPMKGWMTDEVTHSVANSVVDIQEAEAEALQKKLEFLRKQRERHDEAASGYREKAQAIRERNPNDTAGADNYDNMADKQEVMAMKQNERIRDIKDQVKKAKGQKDEQVISFFDTYRNMQEEVADITVDPRNKIAKVNQQNTHALNIHKAAQRMGLKSAMVGKNIRVKGSKKNINDFMRVVIGKSSYGDPTEKDMSTPQIDKMLNKNLK